MAIGLAVALGAPVGPGLRAQEGVPAPAAGEEPAGDPTQFPPWFRELIDLVVRSAGEARTRAEAKLAEARAAGDRATQAWALLMIGTAQRRLNDYPAANASSREALALAEQMGDDLLRFNAHYIHGRNRYAAGDLSGALDHYLRSLAYADARGSGRARLAALGAVAVTHRRLGDLPRARAAHEEAIALAEERGDARAAAMYAGNLASLLREVGDFAGARRNYERELEFALRSGRQLDIDSVRESLAMLDFAEGRPESALAVLEEMLPRRRKLRGKVRLTGTLLNLAEVQRHLGRLDEARALVDEARGHARGIESPRLRASVEAEDAALHEARGDFAAALAAARREFALREAMTGEAARRRAEELQAQYDVARKEQELERLTRVNEAQAAENRVAVAELRAREAEVRARNADLAAARAELERARAARLAVGAGSGALLLVLAVLAFHLRSRLRAERRIHAETEAARRAAEEADRLKTRFLGIASHDIRSPLGSIAMLADQLRGGQGSAEEGLEHAALIAVEARRVMQLVEDFLVLASLEAGRFELRRAPVHAGELLTAAAGTLRAMAEARRQRIVVTVDDAGGPVVELDADRVHQVLTNLLSNALKYGPAGGTVEASVRAAGAGVVFAVKDQGPGLAPAEVAQLFQPYRRLGVSPGNGTSSHGLGLSIAQEIVQRHGGRIRVESVPGAGATFLVELPSRPAAA